MTPSGPEWRRARGDAVLDAEAKEWDKYKIVTTRVKPWDGQVETWHKAVQSGKRATEWRMKE